METDRLNQANRTQNKTNKPIARNQTQNKREQNQTTRMETNNVSKQ